jgi:hypothetical protein
MPDSSFRRFYRRADFVAMVPAQANLPLFTATLGALALATPVGEVRQLPDGGAAIEWPTVPSTGDIALVDAAVAAFVGGATTSAPFEHNSFGISTSTSATPVEKINQTTPPLDAGTYQVIWTTSLRMQAVVANTGVEGKIRLTRSDGVFVEQDDAWNLSNRHAFNGAITFQVAAGQTLTSLLTFSRLGASGTAEMSGARITVDKIS